MHTEAGAFFLSKCLWMIKKAPASEGGRYKRRCNRGEKCGPWPTQAPSVAN
jgi:hypothetical protein